MDNAKRGWGWPPNTMKAHYFNGSIVSLCSKWMYAGELHDTMHDHPDNCADCVKRRNKQEALLAPASGETGVGGE